MQDKITTMEN